MRAAGMTLIRVGESVWTTWEPREGQFDLDWLEPVLDAAHERGISVILGTPTYAAPPWLVQRYPEIAGDTATGTPLAWGSRQEMDFTHPAFLFHAERVIRAVIGRYAEHPAIIGYQVDNEPGLRLLHNEGIFERFIDHLRRQYGTVERLNEEWGLVYWSHRITNWHELWRPDGNLQPQYDLAWRRFQGELVDEYIAWQAEIVRETVGRGPKAPFVTTCISYDQLAIDDVHLSIALDLASANVYYDMQDTLAVPSSVDVSPDWILDGTWAVYELADRAYSSKQRPFWVTETNGGAIGHSWLNRPGYDGQLRQIAWALVSRGAQAVEYWNWHTLHYGAETFWVGVLPHDEEPGRTYEQIARIGEEFGAVGDELADAEPEADLAFLYSTDAKWALSGPALATLPTGRREGADVESYRRLALPFYRAVFDAGLQVHTVRPQQLLEGEHFGDAGAFALRRPVLVVPADFTTTDDRLDWLLSYVESGGHLVLGPRTAYGDHEGRARRQRKPARLAEAAGVWYQESGQLDEAVRLLGADGFPLPEGSRATVWADYLMPTTATVLAEYDDRHLGRWAAITTAEHGSGRITTVGCLPDSAAGVALARWLVPDAVAGWEGLPADVRVTSMRTREGKRVWFVHHWGWGTAEVTAPGEFIDLLDGAGRATGSRVSLGPWDVRVLREA